MTSLSSSGYKIPKALLQDDDLEYIRTQLKVKPYNMMDAEMQKEDTSFTVYRETRNDNIYVPKHFGLQHFGIPENDKLMNDDIEKTNIEFQGNLRKEQEAPVSAFIGACEDPERRGGIISLQCAAGKCLAKDTPVVMFDGSISLVQNIQRGDVLMGDDSTQRLVLTTTKGKERMYRIKPNTKYADEYVVNESHILSLTNKFGDVCDVPLKEYMMLSPCVRDSLYGYSVALKFDTVSVTTNPYDFALHWSKGNDSFADSCELKKYLANDEKTRLEFLAGVIDSCVCYVSSYETDALCVNSIDTNLSSKDLATLQFLIRSLGLGCFLNVISATLHIKVGCNIALSSIPTKKNAIKQLINLVDSVTDSCQLCDKNIYGFTVESLSVDDYYGFTIDGNRRFVLGDCSVTHNTVMALYITSKLAVKTLVVVHKEFLLNQWKERIGQFLPDARVGFIKGPVCDVENKDIVIGSLQSLSMKKFPKEVFSGFGFVIYDEVHHCAAQVFSRVFYKVTTQYTLGLSATVQRKDGLTKVFKWHIGDIVYKNKKKVPDVMKIITKEYYHPDHNYSRVHSMFNNKPNMSKMINNICDFMPRTEFIIDCLQEVMKSEPNRKVLILSDRRNHLIAFSQVLTARGLTWGYYFGGLKKEVLDESETKQVLLGTYAYVSEGFDMKGLNTLILASPKSDIIQSVGRITRDKPEDRVYQALVIDIVDNFSIFPSQARKRMKYYESQKYEIEKDVLYDDSNMQEFVKGICHIKFDEE